MKLANSNNGIISSGTLSGIVVQWLINFTVLLNFVRNPVRRYKLKKASAAQEIVEYGRAWLV
jgi:hypothetical protein